MRSVIVLAQTTEDTPKHRANRWGVHRSRHRAAEPGADPCLLSCDSNGVPASTRPGYPRPAGEPSAGASTRNTARFDRGSTVIPAVRAAGSCIADRLLATISMPRWYEQRKAAQGRRGDAAQHPGWYRNADSLAPAAIDRPLITPRSRIAATVGPTRKEPLMPVTNPGSSLGEPISQRLINCSMRARSL